jgi:hypothetical protein
MTEPEFAAWLAMSIPAYAADKVAAGQWSEEDSLELSRKEYAELLPQGLETPDNFLFTITDAQAAAVGALWFAVKTKFNARVAMYSMSSFGPDASGRAMRFAPSLLWKMRFEGSAYAESRCTSSDTIKGRRPCTPGLAFSPRTLLYSNR